MSIMGAIQLFLFCFISLNQISNVYSKTMSSRELKDLLSSLRADSQTSNFLLTYYDALNTTGTALLDFQDIAPVYKAMDKIALTFVTVGQISRSDYMESVRSADAKVRVAVEKLYGLFDKDKNNVIDHEELELTLRPRVVFFYVDLLILGADLDGDKRVTEDEYKRHIATADYVTGDAHKAFLEGNFNYADLDDNTVVEMKDLQILFPHDIPK
uniref:EF-hand domain-containing protein n=2 Tax=Biomphalaria glabrata TaxID=6526 RepID=A0A2C9KFG0_BIOGL